MFTPCPQKKVCQDESAISVRNNSFVNLPSFLWLWRIAAWSMGLAVTGYMLLALTGGWMWVKRSTQQQPCPPGWLRALHLTLGFILASLVLLLLGIGIVGTLGHFGSLGHSMHLPVGLAVVGLTLMSAWSAVQISPAKLWARTLHLTINLFLGVALTLAGITGWDVVQKYLPG